MTSKKIIPKNGKTLAIKKINLAISKNSIIQSNENYNYYITYKLLF